MLRFKSDWLGMDGGVSEPVVGVVPWLPSLDASVDLSVRKLALDRLRSSLKLRKEGGIAQPLTVNNCLVCFPLVLFCQSSSPDTPHVSSTRPRFGVKGMFCNRGPEISWVMQSGH